MRRLVKQEEEDFLFSKIGVFEMKEFTFQKNKKLLLKRKGKKYAEIIQDETHESLEDSKY